MGQSTESVIDVHTWQKDPPNISLHQEASEKSARGAGAAVASRAVFQTKEAADPKSASRRNMLDLVRAMRSSTERYPNICEERGEGSD